MYWGSNRVDVRKLIEEPVNPTVYSPEVNSDLFLTSYSSDLCYFYYSTYYTLQTENTKINMYILLYLKRITNKDLL